MRDVSPESRSALRMELVEFLSSRLPGEASLDLFELAFADPQIFFVELLGRHQAGELVLPDHLVRAINRDFGHRKLDRD
jgi:hypothetical protein